MCMTSCRIYLVLQLGSEYLTCSVFKWSIVVRLLNCSSRMWSELWTILVCIQFIFSASISIDHLKSELFAQYSDDHLKIRQIKILDVQFESPLYINFYGVNTNLDIVDGACFHFFFFKVNSNKIELTVHTSCYSVYTYSVVTFVHTNLPCRDNL